MKLGCIVFGNIYYVPLTIKRNGKVERHVKSQKFSPGEL